MSVFRRTIAIFMLVLFTCQAVLAGIDEHIDWSSGDVVESAEHATVAEHAGQDDSAHDHTGTPSPVDSDCCHASGHCHLLAFMGQAVDVAILHVTSRSAPRTCTYHSLFSDTLLRPPARA